MKMIPAYPLHTGSRAEMRVFDQLRAAFHGQPGWFALHSLNLPEHVYKRFGEIDFLVCGPGGLFVLEVKGGGVACRDGFWETRNRFGNIERLPESPFRQAASALHSLAKRLPPPLASSFVFGYGVITPDTENLPKSAEWERAVLADARDFRQFEKWLERLVAHWRAKDTHPPIAAPALLEQLQQFLRPDFECAATLHTGAARQHFPAGKASAQTPPLTEFDFITHYFGGADTGSGVALGVGDDCALLVPAPGQHIAVTSDALVQGVHFFADVPPDALGHKALSVNLSDLAACGAAPLAFTLSLALPPELAQQNEWIRAFADGLLACAREHGCPLVGGDTCAAPVLTISITALGSVPPAQALRRDGARAGDEVWASGTLGDARLALGVLQGRWTLPPTVLAAARARLERPAPRLALGQALRGVASACIDVSDGLAGDLGHILRASGVGACLDAAALADCLSARTALHTWPENCPSALELALAGGDDYELAFTAPPAAREKVLAAAQQAGCSVRCIGTIEAACGLRLRHADGHTEETPARAFEHF